MTQQLHKCGLYLRVSTPSQAQVKEGSLINQEEKLAAYINNKRIVSGDDASWIVVKKYEQEVRTAKDIVHRPQFLEMKKDIEDGLINTVVFTDISRLSRSTRDFLEFTDFLKKHGANFICISHDGIDTSTDYGKAIFTILTALEEQKAELERWEKKQATEPKIANILKNSKKSIKELPPQQQIQLIKQLLIGIALTQNTIKLDPRLGKPITGNIKKNPQRSSHPYSYLDLDWE